MKITIEIDTQYGTPMAMVRYGDVLQRLATAFNTPDNMLAAVGDKTDPQPAAAKATRTKAEKPVEPVPSTANSAPVSAIVTAATSVPVQSAEAFAPSASDAIDNTVVVSDLDIVAAANAAAAAIGASGAGKIKTWIAESFTKADGSPGTLKTTAPDQHARLVDGLQKIARKEIVL